VWLAAAGIGLALCGRALAVEKIDPDPKGVKLCSDFLAALAIEDEAKRIEAAIPLLHKTLLTDDGKDLRPDVKRFAFSKASKNAKFYKQPAEVTAVHKGMDQTVGAGKQAEKGRSDKYFVAKKDGAAGLPAPLHVFWPADGGAPKLINVGSL
jgi:hypothetical protein